MKGIKRILGGAMAFTMLCSVTSFNSVKAETKDIPKYLKDDTIFISEAYMYKDKALTNTINGKLYYDKKLQYYGFNEEFEETRASEKYAYVTNHKEYILFNLEDGSKENALPMIDKMNKAINTKYGLNLNRFSITNFIQSDNDEVLWAEFNIEKDKKNILGLVSSKGELIEVPFKENDNYEITMHNNKAYILYETKGKYNIDVYESGKEKVELCKIDEECDNDLLRNLIIDDNNDMYILYKGQKDSGEQQKEICKVNIDKNKGELSIIAKYDKCENSNVTVDNNKNIWYLCKGLIYKIENDKPVLKYEVQENKTNLYVSDDNNLIVTRNEYNPNSTDTTLKTTIINLSDKYTNGWVKEDDWKYYEDRQAVTNDWRKIDGKWYYFSVEGCMIQNCMYYQDGNMYYFNPSGDAAIGWKKINDNWYYFNDDCTIATGWIKSNGKWYYLSKDAYSSAERGFMVNDGWKKIDGKWYYMNNDGTMATGWIKDDGAWYYLNDSGSITVGWEKINGSWYYFYNNGVMAHNTTIDGYKIGSNGAMI